MSNKQERMFVDNTIFTILQKGLQIISPLRQFKPPDVDSEDGDDRDPGLLGCLGKAQPFAPKHYITN